MNITDIILIFLQNFLSFFIKDSRKIILLNVFLQKYKRTLKSSNNNNLNFYVNKTIHNIYNISNFYTFFRKKFFHNFTSSYDNNNLYNFINSGHKPNIVSRSTQFKNMQDSFIFNFKIKSKIKYDFTDSKLIDMYKLLNQFKTFPVLIDRFVDTGISSKESLIYDKTGILYPFFRFKSDDIMSYLFLFSYFCFEILVLLCLTNFFFGSIVDVFFFLKNNFFLISPFFLFNNTHHKVLVFFFFSSLFFLIYNILEWFFQQKVDPTSLKFHGDFYKAAPFFSFCLSVCFDLFYMMPLVFIWIIFLFKFLSFFIVLFKFFLFPIILFPFFFIVKGISRLYNILFNPVYWQENYFNNFFYIFNKKTLFFSKNYNYHYYPYSLNSKLNKKFLFRKNFSGLNNRGIFLRTYPIRLDLNNIYLWNFDSSVKLNKKKLGNVFFVNFLLNREKQYFPRFKTYRIKNPNILNYLLFKKIYLLLKKKNDIVAFFRKKHEPRRLFFYKPQSFLFSQQLPLKQNILRNFRILKRKRRKRSRLFLKIKKRRGMRRFRKKRLHLHTNGFFSFFRDYKKYKRINKFFSRTKKYLLNNNEVARLLHLDLAPKISFPLFKKKLFKRKISLKRKIRKLMSRRRSHFRMYDRYLGKNFRYKKRRVIKKNIKNYLSHFLLFRYFYFDKKHHIVPFLNFSDFFFNFKQEFFEKSLSSRLYHDFFSNKNVSSNPLRSKSMYYFRKNYFKRRKKMNFKKKKFFRILTKRKKNFVKRFFRKKRKFFIRQKRKHPFIFFKFLFRNLSPDKIDNYYNDFFFWRKRGRGISNFYRKKDTIRPLKLRLYRKYLFSFNVLKRHFLFRSFKTSNRNKSLLNLLQSFAQDRLLKLNEEPLNINANFGTKKSNLYSLLKLHSLLKLRSLVKLHEKKKSRKKKQNEGQNKKKKKKVPFKLFKKKLQENDEIDTEIFYINNNIVESEINNNNISNVNNKLQPRKLEFSQTYNKLLKLRINNYFFKKKKKLLPTLLIPIRSLKKQDLLEKKKFFLNSYNDELIEKNIDSGFTIQTAFNDFDFFKDNKKLSVFNNSDFLFLKLPRKFFSLMKKKKKILYSKKALDYNRSKILLNNEITFLPQKRMVTLIKQELRSLIGNELYMAARENLTHSVKKKVYDVLKKRIRFTLNKKLGALYRLEKNTPAPREISKKLVNKNIQKRILLNLYRGKQPFSVKKKVLKILSLLKKEEAKSPFFYLISNLRKKSKNRRPRTAQFSRFKRSLYSFFHSYRIFKNNRLIRQLPDRNSYFDYLFKLQTIDKLEQERDELLLISNIDVENQKLKSLEDKISTDEQEQMTLWNEERQSRLDELERGTYYDLKVLTNFFWTRRDEGLIKKKAERKRLLRRMHTRNEYTVSSLDRYEPNYDLVSYFLDIIPNWPNLYFVDEDEEEYNNLIREKQLNLFFSKAFRNFRKNEKFFFSDLIAKKRLYDLFKLNLFMKKIYMKKNYQRILKYFLFKDPSYLHLNKKNNFSWNMVLKLLKSQSRQKKQRFFNKYNNLYKFSFDIIKNSDTSSLLETMLTNQERKKLIKHFLIKKKNDLRNIHNFLTLKGDYNLNQNHFYWLGLYDFKNPVYFHLFSDIFRVLLYRIEDYQNSIPFIFKLHNIKSNMFKYRNLPIQSNNIVENFLTKIEEKEFNDDVFWDWKREEESKGENVENSNNQNIEVTNKEAEKDVQNVSDKNSQEQLKDIAREYYREHLNLDYKNTLENVVEKEEINEDASNVLDIEDAEEEDTEDEDNDNLKGWAVEKNDKDLDIDEENDELDDSPHTLLKSLTQAEDEKLEEIREDEKLEEILENDNFEEILEGTDFNLKKKMLDLILFPEIDEVEDEKGFHEFELKLRSTLLKYPFVRSLTSSPELRLIFDKIFKKIFEKKRSLHRLSQGKSSVLLKKKFLQFLMEKKDNKNTLFNKLIEKLSRKKKAKRFVLSKLALKDWDLVLDFKDFLLLGKPVFLSAQHIDDQMEYLTKSKIEDELLDIELYLLSLLDIDDFYTNSKWKNRLINKKLEIEKGKNLGGDFLLNKVLKKILQYYKTTNQFNDKYSLFDKILMKEKISFQEGSKKNFNTVPKKSFNKIVPNVKDNLKIQLLNNYELSLYNNYLKNFIMPKRYQSLNLRKHKNFDQLKKLFFITRQSHYDLLDNISKNNKYKERVTTADRFFLRYFFLKNHLDLGADNFYQHTFFKFFKDQKTIDIINRKYDYLSHLANFSNIGGGYDFLQNLCFKDTGKFLGQYFSNIDRKQTLREYIKIPLFISLLKNRFFSASLYDQKLRDERDDIRSDSFFTDKFLDVFERFLLKEKYNKNFDSVNLFYNIWKPFFERKLKSRPIFKKFFKYDKFLNSKFHDGFYQPASTKDKKNKRHLYQNMKYPFARFWTPPDEMNVMWFKYLHEVSDVYSDSFMIPFDMLFLGNRFSSQSNSFKFSRSKRFSIIPSSYFIKHFDFNKKNFFRRANMLKSRFFQKALINFSTYPLLLDYTENKFLETSLYWYYTRLGLKSNSMLGWRKFFFFYNKRFLKPYNKLQFQVGSDLTKNSENIILNDNLFFHLKKKMKNYLFFYKFNNFQFNKEFNKYLNDWLFYDLYEDSLDLRDDEDVEPLLNFELNFLSLMKNRNLWGKKSGRVWGRFRKKFLGLNKKHRKKSRKLKKKKKINKKININKKKRIRQIQKKNSSFAKYNKHFKHFKQRKFVKWRQKWWNMKKHFFLLNEYSVFYLLFQKILRLTQSIKNVNINKKYQSALKLKSFSRFSYYHRRKFRKSKKFKMRKKKRRIRNLTFRPYRRKFKKFLKRISRRYRFKRNFFYKTFFFKDKIFDQNFLYKNFLLLRDKDILPYTLKLFPFSNIANRQYRFKEFSYSSLNYPLSFNNFYLNHVFSDLFLNYYQRSFAKQILLRIRQLDSMLFKTKKQKSFSKFYKNFLLKKKKTFSLYKKIPLYYKRITYNFKSFKKKHSRLQKIYFLKFFMRQKLISKLIHNFNKYSRINVFNAPNLDYQTYIKLKPFFQLRYSKQLKFNSYWKLFRLLRTLEFSFLENSLLKQNIIKNKIVKNNFNFKTFFVKFPFQNRNSLDQFIQLSKTFYFKKQFFKLSDQYNLNIVLLNNLLRKIAFSKHSTKYGNLTLFSKLFLFNSKNDLMRVFSSRYRKQNINHSVTSRLKGDFLKYTFLESKQRRLLLSSLNYYLKWKKWKQLKKQKLKYKVISPLINRSSFLNEKSIPSFFNLLPVFIKDRFLSRKLLNTKFSTVKNFKNFRPLRTNDFIYHFKFPLHTRTQQINSKLSFFENLGDDFLKAYLLYYQLLLAEKEWLFTWEKFFHHGKRTITQYYTPSILRKWILNYDMVSLKKSLKTSKFGTKLIPLTSRRRRYDKMNQGFDFNIVKIPPFLFVDQNLKWDLILSFLKKKYLSTLLHLKSSDDNKHFEHSTTRFIFLLLKLNRLLKVDDKTFFFQYFKLMQKIKMPYSRFLFWLNRQSFVKKLKIKRLLEMRNLKINDKTKALFFPNILTIKNRKSLFRTLYFKKTPFIFHFGDILFQPKSVLFNLRNIFFKKYYYKYLLNLNNNIFFFVKPKKGLVKVRKTVIPKSRRNLFSHSRFLLRNSKLFFGRRKLRKKFLKKTKKRRRFRMSFLRQNTFLRLNLQPRRYLRHYINFVNRSLRPFTSIFKYYKRSKKKIFYHTNIRKKFSIFLRLFQSSHFLKLFGSDETNFLDLLYKNKNKIKTSFILSNQKYKALKRYSVKRKKKTKRRKIFRRLKKKFKVKRKKSGIFLNRYGSSKWILKNNPFFFFFDTKDSLFNFFRKKSISNLDYRKLNIHFWFRFFKYFNKLSLNDYYIIEKDINLQLHLRRNFQFMKKLFLKNLVLDYNLSKQDDLVFNRQLSNFLKYRKYNFILTKITEKMADVKRYYSNFNFFFDWNNLFLYPFNNSLKQRMHLLKRFFMTKKLWLKIPHGFLTNFTDLDKFILINNVFVHSNKNYKNVEISPRYVSQNIFEKKYDLNQSLLQNKNYTNSTFSKKKNYNNLILQNIKDKIKNIFFFESFLGRYNLSRKIFNNRRHFEYKNNYNLHLFLKFNNFFSNLFSPKSINNSYDLKNLPLFIGINQSKLPYVNKNFKNHFFYKKQYNRFNNNLLFNHFKEKVLFSKFKNSFNKQVLYDNQYLLNLFLEDFFEDDFFINKIQRLKYNFYKKHNIARKTLVHKKKKKLLKKIQEKKSKQEKKKKLFNTKRLITTFLLRTYLERRKILSKSKQHFFYSILKLLNKNQYNTNFKISYKIFKNMIPKLIKTFIKKKTLYELKEEEKQKQLLINKREKYIPISKLNRINRQPVKTFIDFQQKPRIFKLNVEKSFKKEPFLKYNFFLPKPYQINEVESNKQKIDQSLSQRILQIMNSLSSQKKSEKKSVSKKKFLFSENNEFFFRNLLRHQNANLMYYSILNKRFLELQKDIKLNLDFKKYFSNRNFFFINNLQNHSALLNSLTIGYLSSLKNNYAFLLKQKNIKNSRNYNLKVKFFFNQHYNNFIKNFDKHSNPKKINVFFSKSNITQPLQTLKSRVIPKQSIVRTVPLVHHSKLQNYTRSLIYNKIKQVSQQQKKKNMRMMKIVAEKQKKLYNFSFQQNIKSKRKRRLNFIKHFKQVIFSNPSANLIYTPFDYLSKIKSKTINRKNKKFSNRIKAKIKQKFIQIKNELNGFKVNNKSNKSSKLKPDLSQSNIISNSKINFQKMRGMRKHKKKLKIFDRKFYSQFLIKSFQNIIKMNTYSPFLFHFHNYLNFSLLNKPYINSFDFSRQLKKNRNLLFYKKKNKFSKNLKIFKTKVLSGLISDKKKLSLSVFNSLFYNIGEYLKNLMLVPNKKLYKQSFLFDDLSFRRKAIFLKKRRQFKFLYKTYYQTIQNFLPFLLLRKNFLLRNNNFFDFYNQKSYNFKTHPSVLMNFIYLDKNLVELWKPLKKTFKLGSGSSKLLWLVRRYNDKLTKIFNTNQFLWREPVWTLFPLQLKSLYQYNQFRNFKTRLVNDFNYNTLFSNNIVFESALQKRKYRKRRKKFFYNYTKKRFYSAVHNSISEEFDSDEGNSGENVFPKEFTSRYWNNFIDTKPVIENIFLSPKAAFLKGNIKIPLENLDNFFILRRTILNHLKKSIFAFKASTGYLYFFYKLRNWDDRLNNFSKDNIDLILENSILQRTNDLLIPSYTNYCSDYLIFKNFFNDPLNEIIIRLHIFLNDFRQTNIIKEDKFSTIFTHINENFLGDLKNQFNIFFNLEHQMKDTVFLDFHNNQFEQNTSQKIHDLILAEEYRFLAYEKIVFYLKNYDNLVLSRKLNRFLDTQEFLSYNNSLFFEIKQRFSFFDKRSPFFSKYYEFSNLDHFTIFHINFSNKLEHFFNIVFNNLILTKLTRIEFLNYFFKWFYYQIHFHKFVFFDYYLNLLFSILTSNGVLKPTILNQIATYYTDHSTFIMNLNFYFQKIFFFLYYLYFHPILTKINFNIISFDWLYSSTFFSFFVLFFNIYILSFLIILLFIFYYIWLKRTLYYYPMVFFDQASKFLFYPTHFVLKKRLFANILSSVSSLRLINNEFFFSSFFSNPNMLLYKNFAIKLLYFSNKNITKRFSKNLFFNNIKINYDFSRDPFFVIFSNPRPSILLNSSLFFMRFLNFHNVFISYLRFFFENKILYRFRSFRKKFRKSFRINRKFLVKNRIDQTLFLNFDYDFFSDVKNIKGKKIISYSYFFYLINILYKKLKNYFKINSVLNIYNKSSKYFFTLKNLKSYLLFLSFKNRFIKTPLFYNTYEFENLPFDLSKIPETLQRTNNNILSIDLFSNDFQQQQLLDQTNKESFISKYNNTITKLNLFYFNSKEKQQFSKFDWISEKRRIRKLLKKKLPIWSKFKYSFFSKDKVSPQFDLFNSEKTNDHNINWILGYNHRSFFTLSIYEIIIMFFYFYFKFLLIFILSFIFFFLFFYFYPIFFFWFKFFFKFIIIYLI